MASGRTVYVDRYRVEVGSQEIELPIVPLSDDVAISLLMTIDVPISFVDRAGHELALLLRSTGADIVVTAATLGIPVATSVAAALGHDRMLVLQKTPKVHLGDALVEPLSSITTDGDQALRLDRALLGWLDGRRAVFVDDVIATGGSAAAALRLIRRGGAEVVGIGSILVEGASWRSALGADAALVRHLGLIPVFRPAGGEGGWREDWGP